jgi:ketosteroid isomerase-like protein
MSEETLETLRRGYEAFSRGDMSAATGLATSDVEWGATGAFPGIEGLYRGPEVIQQWANAVHSDWERFEVSLDEVLHDGDDLVVVSERLRGRDRGGGDDVEMRIYAAYWFEGEKVRRRAASTSRKAALEAAGLQE